VSATEQLRALAVSITAATATAARAAGAVIRDEALSNARAAAGGDLALSGKHRAIPLDVELTEEIRPDGGTVTVTGTPAGPWRWIETGTKPHTIPRRRRGPKSRLRVHHPGTRGKHAWSTTVEAAPELLRAAALDVIVAEIGAST
jgi:hypothetical protein